MHYVENESADIGRLHRQVKASILNVQDFFDQEFRSSFEIYIHPSRAALDAQWQKDWQAPDFKSECWMVASGIGSKLDLLSPSRWQEEACEHKADDTVATQKLIEHEVMHVFHGQINPSHDFNAVQGLDWLVEGVATYASGQLTSKRVSDLRSLLAENKMPLSLDDYWKGKHKYGLSGGLVKYIDHVHGRKVLFSLLSLTTRQQALEVLKTTEKDLIDSFKKYISMQ